MPGFFAFIGPSELSSRNDPVTVLRTAPTEAELTADPNYDPDHTSLWARADVGTVKQPPLQITNLQTGATEPACVCQMATQ
jgi:hypothetical protein